MSVQVQVMAVDDRVQRMEERMMKLHKLLEMLELRIDVLSDKVKSCGSDSTSPR